VPKEEAEVNTWSAYLCGGLTMVCVSKYPLGIIEKDAVYGTRKKMLAGCEEL
jgi:hypothetical protein